MPRWHPRGKHLRCSCVSAVRFAQAGGRGPVRPRLLKRSADTRPFVHATPSQAVLFASLHTASPVHEEKTAVLKVDAFTPCVQGRITQRQLPAPLQGSKFSASCNYSRLQ